ncbi:hypothetical protein [Cryobacterium sp. TMT3-29-2]|uniref:hypothetical protein n=1 Tax=Cryobacterium sp. TMT3-29-2 TaxID=2555867 RepID=UPI00351211B0
MIPPDSWYGTLLKGTLNFSPATTWIELAAWLAYLLPALTLFILKSRQGRPTSTTGTAAPERQIAIAAVPG